MNRVLAIDQELLSWLAPILELVLTACIVVTASVIVERSGPLIGALVVTLPVTVWPAYLFLSLEHSASYIAASAEVGLAVNAVSGAFLLLYLVLAQKRNLALSLGVAIGGWTVLAGLVYSFTWTLLGAGALNLLVYPLCLALCNRYRAVRVPLLVRQWYELPARAATVCIMMAGVLLLSRWGGPRAAGLLAVFPISTTCTILILHPRIGGRASAAVIANGLWGLFGIGLGLFALASSVLTWGLPLALALLFAIPVSWNLSVWRIHRRLGSEAAIMRLRPTYPALRPCPAFVAGMQQSAGNHPELKLALQLRPVEPSTAGNGLETDPGQKLEGTHASF